MPRAVNMGASATPTGPLAEGGAASASPAKPSVPSAERRAWLALERIVAATHSHLDGRDLLAELHPRKTLDIKRRVDGVETWFEGDWLSVVWDAVKEAKALLYSRRIQAEREEQFNRVMRREPEQQASAIEARRAADSEAGAVEDESAAPTGETPND